MTSKSWAYRLEQWKKHPEKREEYNRKKAENDRKKYQEKRNDPRIDCPRITGTIAAFNIKVKGKKGYLNSVGKIIKASALRVGVFIRPLGDVVYLMPPLCITDEELEKCYFGIQEGLNSLS